MQGGWSNIPISGPAAGVITRPYHLYSMAGNRLRVATDWAVNATTRAEAASFGVISAETVPLDVENPRP